ncbi:MAG: hypothetical protein ACRETI_02270 [Steroidobacteraceae bacterium]
MSIDTMCRSLQRCILLLIACVAAAPVWAQRGALTVPRNLDQLTDRAADIVRGTVVSARVEKHPEFGNLDTVLVTLRVRETLKGQAQGTFTFRQYIWDIRDKQDAAGYMKGQDMLLLMIAPSSHGLSSPAGMDQGRFRIERDRSGREFAMNGQGNLRLFDGLQAEAAKEGIALAPAQANLVAKHRKGPIEVRELAALIRAFARSE